jgi:spore germination cell wall hydrolase CwlJ-like protein
MKRWFLLCFLFVFSVQAAEKPRGTYGQQVVAAVLMAEAWGEGPEAMTAVAEVIRRRADEWGVSPLAVVKRVKHFSCLNSTCPEQLLRKFHRKPDFDVALKIARTAYNRPDDLPGLARGATHFHDHSKTPYWASGERPVAVIGNLSFYRLSI